MVIARKLAAATALAVTTVGGVGALMSPANAASANAASANAANASGTAPKREVAAAALNPVWCGGWLQQPSKASSKQMIKGSYAAIRRDTTIRVLKGKYRGKWYAWALLKNTNISTEGVALLWKNAGNNGWYQCGNRNGRDRFQVSGCSNVKCTRWSAGVDAAHATRVQAKYAYRYYTEKYGLEYGHAVKF